MALVSTGALVLCMILQPNLGEVSSDGKTEPKIQKTLGIVKDVFKKKVVRDSKDIRLAIHEDKDMLVVETLDGEAQITIGADACKRVVEPEEFKALKELLDKKESKSAPKKNTDPIIDQKPQSDAEKADLLKQLEK